MVKLGVNIDHIATLRQQRKVGYPSVLEAAKIVEEVGADQITVHLREDRRHIQDEDVVQLKKILTIPLNLEMSINKEIVNFALKVKPNEVCIVPERRQELTTEGGLDLKKHYKKLKTTIEKLKKEGIFVSLFIEPKKEDVLLSKELGADAVEIHTGKYSLCKVGTKKFQMELERIKNVSKIVLQQNLILNAGHGLDYNNVKPIAEIEGMNTLNIGFSIISRAVFVGLKQAVEEMLKLIR
ncbi:MAG: pyridoxine 5'-phosphate synthase [Elusimicrobiota bacterium]|nr:pyridoxine 5'-phosphate synthase [Endomicrobiia bacterium]MDW8165735.1 pyridoxine 5'-phosphate synthase [Elusimicrobiota bacterium]